MMNATMPCPMRSVNPGTKRWPNHRTTVAAARFTFAAMVSVAFAILGHVDPTIGQDRDTQERGTQAPEGEAYFFTPNGFTNVGLPKTASGAGTGSVELRVRDSQTGLPTPCRMNVVGPDGHFYQPESNPLSPYSLTGDWPAKGAWGNRKEKAPYRYLGRFFYSTGQVRVAVPAGEVQIQVWKGLEYRPIETRVRVAAGESRSVDLTLERTAPVDGNGYTSGDTHLHFPRKTDEDDETICQLLAAEDIRYGTPLGYNEPAGPYSGFMEKMDSPQFRKLGAESLARRGPVQILSGQEYRSSTYGHLNLYLRNHLVFPGENLNANDWPVYGHVGAETQALGGMSIHAHGGYALEIYADAALGTVNAVELLQFGVYRGIGLNDWYQMLNCGYRFPCVGASDFPACRFLADCRTYAWTKDAPSKGDPTIVDWLLACGQGQSFVTTGPLLLLEVDGKRPGEIIRLPGKKDASSGKNSSGSSNEPRTVRARVRVRCEVTPVKKLEWIVNGQITRRDIPAEHQRGSWWDTTLEIPVHEPVWIAARAYATTPGGQPDAESHTNPIYVYVDGRTPFVKSAADQWLERLDQQIAVHTQRTFAQKAKVLAYFQQARDTLLKVREQGGLGADQHPSQLLTSKARAGTDRESHTDLAADPSRMDATEAELREFLKPVPPKPPAEAIKTFEAVNGFRMELVAAEPLVYDPVAAAFDENGNLYVCEMRDYPFKPAEDESPRKKPWGSIRLLRDTDGDGVFDRGELFADGLLWAAGVVPWKGGVFVAAPPDIWYLKDTDGDFRADERRQVFTGFGLENQQAMVNNLQFGFDHWIYGSTAGNGGAIRATRHPERPPISVNGRDFRFDPRDESFQPVTGTVQFGNTFDDWGNRFVCSESQPLQHVVLPDHYLARNPFWPAPGGIHNIAPGPVPIFRISPVERWRQVRSGRRIAKNERAATSAGASHHVVDAAAGVTVYRGGAYPPEYYGNILIGDGQNNLIHRRVLDPLGLTFQSHRADERTEFVRSSDIWFRPVNFVNAPDGTLYCLDMSREVLESIHIPLDVVRHLDLSSGRETGRIYRIAPPGFTSPPPPRLGSATMPELVAALESPHGWWRDTAQRLIFERQDRTAVPALLQLVAKSQRPESRILGLWSLEGLDALDVATVNAALNDAHPEVRIQALRLAERHLRTGEIPVKALLSLEKDPNPRVQFQLACSLGETSDPRAAELLARYCRQYKDDPWMRTAVVSSAIPHAGLLFTSLLSNDAGKPSGKIPSFAADVQGLAILKHLAFLNGVVVRHEPERPNPDSALASLARIPDADFAELLLVEFARGLRRSGTKLTVSSIPAETEFLRHARDKAMRTAQDRTAETQRRQTAIELLSCVATAEHHVAEHRELLIRLMRDVDVDAVRIAAMRALSDDADARISQTLIDLLNTFSPDARRAALDVLLAKEDRAEALLKHAIEHEWTLADVEPVRRDLLRKHRNARLRSLAEQLFAGQANAARQNVLAEYQVSLQLPGDAARGKAVFAATCAGCHQLDGQGFAVGPNLASSPSRDPSALLVHILDPNQYVLPNYLQYVVVDQAGRTYTGILAAQSATSVTVKRDQNETFTVLRDNIEEVVATNKSLMPEGVERSVSTQAMADLLAYLISSQRAGQDPKTIRDFGTLPGLIEPEVRK